MTGQAALLAGAIGIRGHTAPSRVLFGPHETNLGRGRALSERHTAYYARRARGGCGVIVTEIASVHPLDHPYERAPLAADCGPGWAEIAAACAGSLVLAGLGHAGAQGSTAWTGQALWGASGVPDVVTREVPQVMEQPEIDAVVAGFAEAAALARTSGLAGVEINAGQHSLLRQFLSGLTNQRTDAYGADRGRLLREVVGAVRAALGEEAVLGLRLCGDELAPWAGITPGSAVAVLRTLAGVDYVVPVRGSGLSVSATRPDLHTPPGFNRDLCAEVGAAVDVPVVLQGSVVDPEMAEEALAAGALLVEMTRAQIADPDLVAHVRAGQPARIRPCTLSNQHAARDPRNPLVSDEAEPRSGHETVDPDPEWPAAVAAGQVSGEAARAPFPDGAVVGPFSPDASVGPLWPGLGVGRGATLAGPDPGFDVLVVGGGPAGLEAARTLALRGHAVRLVERDAELGGALRLAAALPGRARMGLLVPWWERELRRLGVVVELGVEVGEAELDAAGEVVLATGSRPRPPGFPVSDGTAVLPAAEFEGAVLAAGGAEAVLAEGPVVVWDPVGDWTGVGVAEQIAAAGLVCALVTPDPVAGTQLGRTGDLADANARLERAGVRRELFTALRAVGGGKAELVDVHTGAERAVACAAVVDCSPRLPDDRLWRARPHLYRAGDCVAPRTVYEAVLEGRRSSPPTVRADRCSRTAAGARRGS